MKTILALLLVAFTSAQAQTVSVLGMDIGPASDSVGVHTVSTHFRDGPNNYNFGAFARYKGIELGDYYNSARKNTFYVGYMIENKTLPLNPALLVGGVTGYKHGVMPFATVSVSKAINQDWALRLEYTKNPAKTTPGIAHLRLEHKY